MRAVRDASAARYPLTALSFNLIYFHHFSKCSECGIAPISGTCGLLFNQATAKMPKPLENTRLFALHPLRKIGQISGLTT